ncbi:MAG: AarF/ABC1/UbiB kinase family protein [Polyangiaceae bacterium]|nr:AarF/ABC1/UbiB kinase family protein [Polyangiaceae bacterium]
MSAPGGRQMEASGGPVPAPAARSSIASRPARSRTAARAVQIARALRPWASDIAKSPETWVDLWLGFARSEPSPASAEQLRVGLEQLGPVFIKAGQLLSTRPDLLPKRYLDALAGLQSSVAPMSDADVTGCLAEYAAELGSSIPFRDFDPTPLAAASLAQVHRATLGDGREVAVKLQRRGVGEVVRRDLRLLQIGARALAPMVGEVYDLPGLVEELELTLSDELSFRAEADALAMFRENLAPFRPLVRVPEVFGELSTERVLITELVHGSPLSDPAASVPPERRRAVATALAHAYFQMFFVDGVFHADPHPGNLLVTDDGIAVLDFGMVGRIERQVADNLVRILLNFVLRDSHGVAHAFLDIGKPTRAADELGWIMEVRRLVPRYHGVRLERLNLGALLVDLLKSAARSGIQAPPVIGLICKSLANMDGTVRRIDPSIDVLETFQSFIPRLLESHARRLASPERAAKVALDMSIGAQRTPFQLATILEKLATGRMRLVVDPLSPGG